MTTAYFALKKMKVDGIKVHESSFIDDGVAIGEDTCIWHFSHVLEGSEIGERCRIGQNVVIGPRVKVGNNVKIQNNVSVYEGVTLEDDVFCGPSVVFTNVHTPRSAFSRNQVEDFRGTFVCRGASIGANATVVCGCRIGEHALVGAGAVVTRDVPPHAVVYGNPARQHGWACECGGILVVEETLGKCNECDRTYFIQDSRMSRVEENATSTTVKANCKDNEPIPVCDVRWQYLELQQEIDEALKAVAENGNYILGPNVKAFEKEVATFFGSEFAVGVGSGTDALHLALRALNIGPGDEVITSPFTFVATTEAIGLVGATPVFIDIDPATFNINSELIESKITNRTRAIIPVHLYGRPCAMDSIMHFARKHRLFVVEDCAQAFGATYRGRPVGTFGDVGCFSFFPTKNLGCMGDGGLVLTGNSELFERVEMLRRHGGRKKYYHEELGLNSRLDEIQAAILRLKLPHIKKWNRLRQHAAKRYSEQIQNISSDKSILKLPPVLGSELSESSARELEHVFHQYTIQSAKREALALHLKAVGISTAIYYPTPLHQQPVHAAKAGSQNDLLQSEKVASEVLSLPMFPGLTNEQIDRVCHEIQKWYGKS